MKKIIILIESLFDEQELIYPYHRFREDYEVELVGSNRDEKYSSKSGVSFKSTLSSAEVNVEDYAGIFIPGGFSPDFMRRCEQTVKLVEEFDKAKKPIAAICHGAWMMASACDIKGKDITSFHSIKDDLENAGANWVDKEVVVSDHLITGRTPVDLPAVVKAFIEQIEE